MNRTITRTMPAEMLLVFIFLAAFGLAVIYLGIRRFLRMYKEPKPVEAAFWGGVGVMLGIAALGLDWKMLQDHWH